ncbi:MAG TPA: ROK family protein [Patescibacteria group bacterium]|nr:ROK family protein [Patescibacteria group bacterium]
MSEPAVIGVDLGGTNVRAGKVVGQQITDHHARAITAHGSEETVLQEIRETIAAVFDKRVAGIGIGVPSLVDVDKGIVYTVENIPSWKEVPLKDILERSFHVPIHVNNDANCFALGELYFGAGRGYRDLVGLVLGTGLGAGIIINGKLYCGRNCGAGEIGTIPFREHTVEYYCSGQFFQNQYGIDGGTLFEQAKQGDAQALEKFTVFGDNLGQAVMIALYAYDPEIVVLGSSASKAWPFFEAALRQRLKDFAWQHALARLVIQPSRTTEIAILGAAALCYDAKK